MAADADCQGTQAGGWSKQPDPQPLGAWVLARGQRQGARPKKMRLSGNTAASFFINILFYQYSGKFAGSQVRFSQVRTNYTVYQVFINKSIYNNKMLLKK